MRTFTLHLQDASQYEAIESVSSFIGEDASGSFGILAGHARMMTTLEFGLARFRVEETDWEYLALPGGLLYFVDNTLYLNTRRYLRDKDYHRISQAVEEQLQQEEAGLTRLKESLRNMEEQMLKRLWRLDNE